MSRVRHRVSLGREVRRAARARSGPRPSGTSRSRCSSGCVRQSPAKHARVAGALPGLGTARAGRSPTCRPLLPASVRTMLALLPDRLPRCGAAARPRRLRAGRGGRASRCSPAACSRRSTRTINHATLRVLAANGVEVVVPRGAGVLRRAGASRRAKSAGRKRAHAALIDAFPADVDAIVTNAAGCGSAMKEYGDVFTRHGRRRRRAARSRSRVRDVSEFLHDLGLVEPAGAARAAVPSPTTTPATSRTRRASEQPPRALLARVAEPARASRSPTARSAVGRPGSTTSSSPPTAGRPGGTEGAGDPRDRRAGGGCREHRMPGADCDAPGPSRSAGPVLHTIQVLDRAYSRAAE